MTVKNISSNIAPEKTIMELEQLLAKFGAKMIVKEYEGESVVAISFYILAPTGEKIPFKLPMKLEKARKVIENAAEARKLPLKYKEEPYRTEKALIVGWRIIKDWVHSMLSLYEIDYADPVEIFFPYAYNPISEKTLYDNFLENKFDGLALEEK